MDERLSQSIDAFIEKEEANIWRDIARLVAINSVEGVKAADAPFGEGPKKALEEAETATAILPRSRIWMLSVQETAGRPILLSCGSGMALSSAAASWMTRALRLSACMP